jgi:hypothetical protein
MFALAGLVIKPMKRDPNKNPVKESLDLCLLYLSEALGVVQNFKYNIYIGLTINTRLNSRRMHFSSLRV